MPIPITPIVQFVSSLWLLDELEKIGNLTKPKPVKRIKKRKKVIR